MSAVFRIIVIIGLGTNIGPAESALSQNLLSVGGYPTDKLVEIVSLDASWNCSKTLAPFPTAPYCSVGESIGESGVPFVCGGQSYSGLEYDECFSLSTNLSWVAETPLNTRRGCAAGALINPDEWWITGGGYRTTTELLSNEGAFSDYIPLPEGGDDHVFFAVDDDRYVFMCGISITDKVHLFDNATGNWTQFPPLPADKNVCQGGVVKDSFGRVKSIVAAGGYKDDTTVIFDFDSGFWRPGPKLEHDVYFAVSVPYKESFIIAGGMSSFLGDVELNTIYYFEPIFEEWTLLDTFSSPRRNFAAFFLDESFVQLACP